jgi:hypothetical protein
VHEEEPACVIVTVCPATVSVPVLCAAVVFAATVNFTVPLPLSGEPDTIEIQVTLLAAVQAQLPAADTDSEELAIPAAATDTLVGLTVPVQDDAAAWLMVTVWPAIVSVPVRAAPVLAEALNPTEPLPLPLEPDVIDSHAALLTAVHVHPFVT